MRTRLVLAIALAALLWSAAAARASCPVTLDGDPALVEQVRGELASFGDDGTPCVALSARCWREGDQLEVAVSDAAGRTAQRAFASTGGAAAFIVSWSLHPPTEYGAPKRPAAPAVTTSQASNNTPWHLEIALGYLGTSGTDHSWATLAPTADKRLEHFRFGGGLRALSGNRTSVANLDVELMLGTVWDIAAHWSIRVELTGAKTLMALTSNMPVEDGYGAVGLRGGGRTVVAWQLEGPLALEVGVGYDLVRTISPTDTSSFGHGPNAGYTRLDFGIRWLP